MGDLLRGVGGVFRSSWRASPGRLLTSIVLMLIGSLSAPATAVLLAVMTSAAIRGDLAAATWAAGAVALVALLNLTMEHFAHIFFFELADLHRVAMEGEIGDLLHGTAGLQQHERHDYADRMELLRRETGAIGEGVQTVLTAITLTSQIVLTAVLLAYVEPWLLVLPLFAAPPLLASRMAAARREQADMETAEQSRLALHLLGLSLNAAAAKEILLFGLQGTLRRRQRQLREAADRRIRRAEAQGLAMHLAGQLIFAIGYIGAVVLIVEAAIRGDRSIGDVILVVTLAVQTNAQAAGAVSVAVALEHNARAMRWLGWLRTEAASTASEVLADQAPPPVLRSGIEFDGVAFRYPGMDRDVLGDVTVKIPAGSVVAVVGDNGAGKSTLVKLLCRFYEPTAGTITVDGLDLRRIEIGRWLGRVAAGFQDFVRLDAPAWQSIGVGDLPRAEQLPAVQNAVDRADAQVVIDRLPEGLQSHLGKAYVDGEELSGGQWQRIALSRAMMRDEPLLLLLDEPTAALDPLTEFALFERWVEAARQARIRTGGITLLVSHRFSTVRMADLILVVADGRVVEQGDHRTLMNQAGRYAEMYEVQAAVYR